MKSLIFPITRLGKLRKQQTRGGPHLPLPLRASTKDRSQISDIPVPCPLVQWEGRIKLLLLPADTHTDSDTARPHLLGAAGGGMVMVDMGGGGERKGALVAPPQSPTVSTSQSNPRPQGRGPRNPHRQRVPSSTPEPASGTSPATLPRPWPLPPRLGQAAQAAQPRPPSPNPDKLQGTAPPAPGRFATAVAPPPPLPGSPSGRKVEWDQGGETTGGGATS